MTVGSVFLVEIDGSPLPSDIEPIFTSAYVDDSLHLPATFLLRFRDPGRVVLAKANIAIGAKVKIKAVAPDAMLPGLLITGEVTAVEMEFDSMGTYTVVRGFDISHRLFRGRRTEVYPQATAADVVRKVAGRAGVTVGKVEATNIVYDHVCQGGESDWEFLGRLAREIGYEIAVTDGKLDFRRPRPASDGPSDAAAENPLVLRPGTNLLRLRCVVTAAGQVKEVQARGWDVAQKQALVATAPAASGGAEPAGVTPAGLARAVGNPVYVSSDVPYGTQAEVDAAAKALAERIGGAFAQFEGVARGNPKLCAGTAVALTNLGEPFDGKYTITTSRHRYEADTGYTTVLSVTGRQDHSLLGLASSGGSPTRSPGVVVAQVSDAKDPTDAGRVKLTFPWLSETYVSDWARTVQAGAGKDRGAIVVPEVGDEVLVAFEQGDLRRPFVVGGLYNGKDVPKHGDVPLVDAGSGEINRRSTVSRRGHRIDLFDQQGKRDGILLATGDAKFSVELDAVKTKVTVHSDGTVLIEGAKGIVVDAGTGKLELKGQQIALTAKQGVTVDGGGGAVEIKAGTRLALKGATATIEGDAQAELKARGVCTVQGALVKIN